MSERVLFLDDDDERHNEFLRHCFEVGGRIVDRAKTAADAIQLLDERSYDLIMLDHDLLPDHVTCLLRGQEPDHSTTGLAVARAIAERHEKFARTHVIIHSCNRSGSTRMLAVLRDAGIAAKKEEGAWLWA